MKYTLLKYFILLGLVITLTNDLHSQSSGLRFFGQGYRIDERTSLELFPQKPFKTNGSFSVEFDLAFQKNHKNYFGYVFRMVNQEGTNIDLIYDNTKRTMNIIVGNNELLLSIPIDKNQLYKWKTVKINFTSESCTFSIGKELSKSEGEFLPKKNSLKIYFGANHEKTIETTSLPNMRIRNIVLRNNNKITHKWLLNNFEGNECIDVIANKKAFVAYPFWLYQNHSNWQLIQDFNMSSDAQITFSHQKNRFYIVTADSLISFNPAEKDKLSGKRFKSPINFIRGRSIIYDKVNERLLRYSIDQQLIASYNFKKNSWSLPIPKMKSKTHFWHHNSFIQPGDSSLQVVGGYGYHEYKNLIQTVDLKNGTWKINEPKKDVLPPRHFAGLGTNATVDSIYILGGFGSIDGDQKHNPSYWYELTRYIPSSGKIEPLFTYDPSKFDGFCFANSMVVDGDFFYALAFSKFNYKNHLQLLKGSLKENYLEPIGSKLPFIFENSNRSFPDLFYSSRDEKLYATINSIDINGNTSIKVYSLSFPPKEIPFSAEENKDEKSKTAIYLIITFSLLIAIAIIILILKRKNKEFDPGKSQAPTKTYEKTKTQTNELEKKSVEEYTIEDVEEESGESDLKISSRCKKNCISLFGGFQLIDNEGVDITPKFTPILKEMFLLIFLSSFGDRKGISPTRLGTTLWGDKTEKVAKNNAAVNVSRLKEIFSNIDGIEISKETAYWKINVDYSIVYVDYEYLYKVKQTDSPGFDKIMHLIKITRKSPFLENCQYDWLDPFKADVSNDIIDILINWANHNSQLNNQDSLIPLADAVFEFDPLNEEALVLKVKALIELGKHSLAKNAYDAFKKDYETLYGEKYQVSFTEIIK